MNQTPPPARLIDVGHFEVVLIHPDTFDRQVERIEASSATSAAYLARTLWPGYHPVTTVEI